MKYKIGTLVVLSAKGRKHHANSGYLKGFGIVLEYEKKAFFPYTVKWFGGRYGTLNAKGYELKKMKKNT
tara:strand:+ start:382 stop:588 length:207 start_codon:yes stop_codon:yes gene_type:complete